MAPRNRKLKRIGGGLENAIVIKVLKQYKRNPCLWDTSDQFYHNKTVKTAAWESLLRIWRQLQPRATLHEVKVKIFHMRTNYTRQRKKVESSAAQSGHYVPTLWYYKHLNFLSKRRDVDSDDSDSDHNEDTVYVQLPRGPRTSASSDQEEDHEPMDTSAWAFGRSVGAQIHHLNKMQRCIAEKLISDIIYHGKMDKLNLETAVTISQPVRGMASGIPQAGPSWYDPALDNVGTESSSSCQPTEASEDLRREIEETQNAVNYIKMESDDIFHHDDQEVMNVIDMVKDELE